MEWRERFSSIYGEIEGKKWIPILEKRITQAIKVLKLEEEKNQKQHVILITYPDQFREEGEKRLQTFQHFSNEYLNGIFDVIHFLPFCPYSSDDGFSVIDYRRLEAQLGDWEDLKNLGKKFDLMYDFVCNHVSAKSEWFQKCLQGDSRYRNYFIEANPTDDFSCVVRPRTTPLLTKFHTKDGERYFWTTFSEDQIDLNYANPEVMAEAIDIFLGYLEKGGKWIRLDAVGFLWKEMGTSCIHHKKTHEIVKLLRSIMDVVYPEGRIITETNVPHKDNISYFGNGSDESHMVYQFPLPFLVLYSFYKQDTEVLSQWAQQLTFPSEHTGFFNFLASHDGIGINPARNIIPEEEIENLVEHLKRESGALISYKENPDGTKSAYEINVSYFSALKETFDFETAKRRFLNAHGVLLGMKGNPAIYIHSYLASENDMEGVEKTGMNRTINRRKFDWTELELQLQDPENPRSQIRRRLEELIRIRKGCDAFDFEADQEILPGEHGVFAFIRKGSTKRVICMHNFSEEMAEMTGVFGIDLLTNEKIEGNAKLEPFGFRWILME